MGRPSQKGLFFSDVYSFTDLKLDFLIIVFGHASISGIVYI